MKFIIIATEKVFYEVEVEAKDKAEVDEMINNGDVNWGKPIDGQNHEVISIEENEDDTK